MHRASSNPLNPKPACAKRFHRGHEGDFKSLRVGPGVQGVGTVFFSPDTAETAHFGFCGGLQLAGSPPEERERQREIDNVYIYIHM